MSPEQYSKVKRDENKPPIHLIPPEAIEGMAKVFAFGANKFDVDDWQNNGTVRERTGSIMRHTLAIAKGEFIDPESGLPHAYHVMAQAAMVDWQVQKKDGSAPKPIPERDK